jgi:hypothetical protein
MVSKCIQALVGTHVFEIDENVMVNDLEMFKATQIF